MEHQNIQPFVLKSGEYANDRPNDNGPSQAKPTWVLKYGTT